MLLPVIRSPIQGRIQDGRSGNPGVYGRSQCTGHHAEAIAAPHIEQSEYWGVLYSEYAKEDLMREVYVSIRAPLF